MRPVKKRDSAAVEIADILRDEILSGVFQQNERLLEPSLALRFERSRGPVREALKLLAGEGLLRQEADYGSSVVSFSPRDVEDLMELRIAIEIEAARTIAMEQNPRKLDVLERRVSALLASAEKGEAKGFAARDLAFHRTMMNLAGNELMTQVFERNVPILHALIRLDGQFYESLTQMAEEHSALLEAMREGNADTAASRVEAHVSKATRLLLSLHSRRDERQPFLKQGANK